ncbi:hypothetical protein ASD54_08775 [Rhizobium sp. Root149]|uniref:hypothetical protein n=1 Tax=Rhizobium sp. Root149 TaxID=1736473 RepID=UPI00071235F0|nr:hypothetical protein [Rhizobium sp. Root149]KQZ50339.1 hypothetical protein ASD54_08775 [Rhizobium sp. Root149]
MSEEFKLEVGRVYDLPETVSMTVTRSWYSNDYGDVELVGPGPLSDRFREIRQEGRAPYLVFADTMRYRMDGERHPLDVVFNWEAVEMGEHPVAAVGAVATAIQDGIVTRREACEYFGIDVQTVDAENERDRQRLAAMNGGAV